MMLFLAVSIVLVPAVQSRTVVVTSGVYGMETVKWCPAALS